MQQTYFCPNCGAPLAYGQPYCANCNTGLTWPEAPTPPQYQSSPDQYPDQQQYWGQQQWYPPTDDQAAGSGYQGQGQWKGSKSEPGLLQRITSNRGAVIKIFIAVIIVVALSGTIIALKDDIVKWFTAPVVSSFDVSSSTITSGQQATLQWDVTGATSVSISPGIGNVSASGTRTVTPETTTTYKLVASNLVGSTSKSKTITVTGKPPSIGSFSSNPGSITAGLSSTLSWSVTDAKSVSINPTIGDVASTGSQSVSPTTTTTYTLTASNDAGTSAASATVTVTISNAPIITTFSASPTSITSGKSAALTWEVTGATSININQGIGGVSSIGSTIITPLATATYTLTASNSYSSITREVTVTVDTSSISPTTKAVTATSRPVITAFSAAPDTLILGDNTTLTWAVTGARATSIIPDVGTVAASGSMRIIPIGTTTYTLSATNSFGTENMTATVTVNTVSDNVTPPAIVAFTAAPGSISAGETSKLTWDIRRATTIIIDHGIGIPDSYYYQSVSPAETTTYKLTAINSAGTDSKTVTVNVTH